MAGADGGIGSTYNIMGWRYLGIVRALQTGDYCYRAAPAGQCNEVIELLIKVGVFSAA